jgi:hypothetical protein
MCVIAGLLPLSIMIFVTMEGGIFGLIQLKQTCSRGLLLSEGMFDGHLLVNEMNHYSSLKYTIM